MAGIVQSGSNGGNATSVAVTLGTAPTTGNLLIAISNSDNVNTISATGHSGGWTLRSTVVNDQGVYLWENTVAGGDSATVTVNSSIADAVAVSVYEVNGFIFDVAGTFTSQTGGAFTSATAATVTAAGLDLVFGVFACHGRGGVSDPVTPVWGNGFAAGTTATGTGGAAGTDAVHFIGTKTLGASGAVGATTTTWTNTASNTSTVLVGYKPSGSGTNYTANPADPVGITDAGTPQQVLVRAPADPVGLLDVATSTQALVRSPADPVGITDSASAAITASGTQAFNDPVGLTDAASTVTGLVRTPPDPLGITDLVTAVIVGPGQQVFGEAVGLTDVVTVVLVAPIRGNYLFMPPRALISARFPGTAQLYSGNWQCSTTWLDATGWHNQFTPDGDVLAAATRSLMGTPVVVDATTTTALVAAGVAVTIGASQQASFDNSGAGYLLPTTLPTTA